MGARLVRDRALESWRVPGAEHQVRPARDRDEHTSLLKAKLLEEVGEVIFSKTRLELTKELADLYEVMLGMAHVHGISWSDIRETAFNREADSGGFRKGMVWETDR